MTQALLLKDRGLIKMVGDDTRTFLQGLITNDLEKLDTDNPVYAGFLTPQGKYLFDFIISTDGTALYLDCEKERAPDLWKRLMMFRLRAKVDITDISEDFRIWAIWGDDPISHPTYNDPRHWKMGKRAIVPKGTNLTLPDDGSEPLTPLKREDYDVERITLGIPNSSEDIKVDKYFWLECRPENNNGVSFNKGCYIGQEQTNRMKHRTTIKKSLMPIKLSGEAKSGDEIVTSEGQNAGEIHSTVRDIGLAYIRLKFADSGLSINDKPITILE